MILLDSDIVSLLYNGHSLVIERIAKVDESEIVGELKTELGKRLK